MIEPDMYPLTDYPTYEVPIESFDDLKRDVEKMIPDLNFVVSWFIHDHHSRDWETSDKVPTFTVLIFMPRKSATTELSTNVFIRSEVETWLNSYVRERTMEWFGWDERG